MVAAFWPKFVARFPSWDVLATSSVTQIEKVLRPIGLAKQRAPRLHALAKVVAERRGRFPADRDTIESLPGVGQYTANAVLLFCHDQPQPLLDVNIARVVERFFGERKKADIRYDPYLQTLATRIVQHEKGKVLNWAVLDFSALVCKARNPLCERCPLRGKCCYGTKQMATKKL